MPRTTIIIRRLAAAVVAAALVATSCGSDQAAPTATEAPATTEAATTAAPDDKASTAEPDASPTTAPTEGSDGQTAESRQQAESQPEAVDATANTPETTTAPGEATGTQQAQTEIYDLTVAAVELWDNDDIGAACALIDKAQTIIDGHTTDPGDDAWQQTVEILAEWGNDCQTALTPTTTTPEPTTTTEPEPTTTTEPEPGPAVARIAEPLERCVADYFWAGLLAALVGTTQEGVYQPIAARGSNSPCDLIMSWWDQITQAEAQKIAQGQYPCEYTAAYAIWPRAAQTSGPPILVGCWPRLLTAAQQLVDETGERRYGPEEEAKRRGYLEGQSILPPNHPLLIEALWACYRDAVQGPLGDWMYIDGCNSLLNSFGNPVRYFGVTPECAAEQYRGKAAEIRTRGWVGDEWQYAGDYSWANCPTRASRLVPAGMETASFADRCEAVIDASIRPEETDATAAGYGLTQAEYIAQIKSMYCAGTLENLKNYPQFHGEWVASWLPEHAPNSGIEAVCLKAALLVAAHKAAYGKWTLVTKC